MFFQYRDLKLIQTSGRPDEDNEAILRGDFLDKSPTYEYPEDYDPSIDGEFGRPIEIPFEIPTRDEMLKQFIFPDWQQGDILVIADSPLKHPKLQGNTLVEMTREEVCESGDLSVLVEGEVYQDGVIIKKEKPKGVKIEWEYPNWVEKATEEEITTYIGNLVTDLLYEALEIGCEVTVNGEKHQQTLADEKRRTLLEKVSGIDLKIASGKELSVVAWPFKDDGSDTVVMSVEDFRTMALYCFDYGDNCYIAAELLKAKRKVNSTIDDFYNELKNVGEISLANL
jgi:hypothetical protein